MSQLAILMVLTSAVLHVAWNTVGKKEKPSAGFFLLALSTIMLCLAPLLGMYWNTILCIPLSLWATMLLAGVGTATYYIALGAAYRSGDMSLAYPLVRAVTVLFMAAASLALNASMHASNGYLMGITLIAGGCLALPIRSRADFHLAPYLTQPCLFAFLAAAGTACGILLDQQVLNTLAKLSGTQLTPGGVLLLYLPLQSLSTVLWLALWTLCNRAEREKFSDGLRSRKGRAAVMGLGMYASYGLLLAARPYVVDLSYAVALRQMSIPLGSAIGMFLLKEPRYLLKSVGAAAITMGAVLVALA